MLTFPDERLRRFLDAAVELMNRSGSTNFTVQQVAERSGHSLRTFYECFRSKDELLLALLEDSLRCTAQHLAETAERIDDPRERLRALLFECHRLCNPERESHHSHSDSPSPPAVAPFALQVLTERPREAAQAFEPLVVLVAHVLADAAASGAIRVGLDHRWLAGLLLSGIMLNTFASTISGSPVPDAGIEDLWDVGLHGIVSQQAVSE